MAPGPARGVNGPAPVSVASTRIADSLRAEILDGRYLPGERIRQEDLAARSGASRIPVREALRMLAAEGLLTFVANSGAWVTKLTLRECTETYLIRERLEPLLLRASMPGLDGAAIDRLAVLADEMERGRGVDAFLRADREFHLASYAEATESQAWQIIHRMWNTTQHYRREFTKLAARSGMRDDLSPPTWSTGCCSIASGAATVTTPSGCSSRISVVPGLNCRNTRKSSTDPARRI
jgi:DNA-binding GntR family transcriptional regulator